MFGEFFLRNENDKKKGLDQIQSALAFIPESNVAAHGQTTQRKNGKTHFILILLFYKNSN